MQTLKTCKLFREQEFLADRVESVKVAGELAGRDKGMMWADVSINDIRTCTHTCSLDCSNTKFYSILRCASISRIGSGN